MTEKFGTLGDMIDYAAEAVSTKGNSRIKQSDKEKPKTNPSNRRRETELVLVPTKAESLTSKKSILKLIKEVHR